MGSRDRLHLVTLDAGFAGKRRPLAHRVDHLA
jgi:hypothetical protein